jgi:hypothetical protein
VDSGKAYVYLLVDDVFEKLDESGSMGSIASAAKEVFEG